MRTRHSFTLAGAAAAVLALTTGAAWADPQVQPKTTDIVAVAVPSLQYLCDAWSIDYNKTISSTAGRLYCFDPTGPSPIQTKGSSSTDPNCNIARPNGAGPDITVLQKKALTHDGHYCVDLALVDRTLKPSDGAGLAGVTLGRDLITWSAVSGGNAVTNLTTTQLTAIYACDASLLGTGHTGPVTWNEVGGTSPDTIVPVLPQSSSGTRADWLTDLGETWTTPPSCIVNGASTVDGTPIAENEGTNSEFTTANPHADDVVFPYSAGVYVAQVYTKTNPTSPGNLTLRNIDGKAPLTPADTINVAGFGAAYIHALYAVVLSTGTSPYVPAYLQPLLGAANQSGFICKGSSTTPGTGPYDLVQAGFAVTALCGTVIL